MIPGRQAAAGVFALALLAAPMAAWAESDILSRDTLSGVVAVRVGAADGEGSWTDGGFGKARFGGEAGAQIDGDLVWRPRFSWDWSGMVDIQAAPDQTYGIDVGEAYARYKPMPSGPTRVQARVGLFYPPISLEHGGGAWLPEDTITPSAINSWVGEELKVAGIEGELTHIFEGGPSLTATAGVFTHGDTAGTLLSLRGWSLGDVKSSAAQRFMLPPLSPFLATKQAPFTTPVKELDGRTGWYGRLAWRGPGLSLEVLYYDNRGDRIAMTYPKEWSWDTRFWSAGAVWAPDERTTVRAQAMHGVTYMGYATPKVWIDAGYNAAYGMVTRKATGRDTLSARLDWFEVTDHTWQAADPNREWGWAGTLAWKRALNDHTDLLVEAMHIDTDGRARTRLGEAEHQSQTVGQAAVRWRF